MIYLIIASLLCIFSVVVLATAYVLMQVSKEAGTLTRRIDQYEVELQMLHGETRELMNRIEQLENRTRHPEQKQVRLYK